MSLRVFLACAMGAFIGGMIALQIDHNFWWTGLLASFSVGCLTYNLGSAMRAVPIAWQRAAQDNDAWHRILMKIEVIFWPLFIMSCAVGGAWAIGTFVWHEGRTPLWPNVNVYFGVCGFSLVMGFFNFLDAADFLYHGDTNELAWMRRKIRYAGLRYNPVVIGPFALWIVARLLYRSGPPFYRFSKHLLVLIHSDLRLLCGMDAAMGVVVGYYFHNAIYGAVVGGLLGVMNFEILSIRILKLVPKKQSIVG